MKGILFQAWKAEAIRTMGADRAWQTRRVMKPQPEVGWTVVLQDGECRVYAPKTNQEGGLPNYGVNSRYHANETVYIKERYDPAVWPSFPPWKSPLFMPAVAARTFLTITGVRVERTRAISNTDCWAEGIFGWPEWRPYGPLKDATSQECYFLLYDSINGAGAHERNWDWVYEFRRVEHDHIVDANKMVGDKGASR